MAWVLSPSRLWGEIYTLWVPFKNSRFGLSTENHGREGCQGMVTQAEWYPVNKMKITIQL